MSTRSDPQPKGGGRESVRDTDTGREDAPQKPSDSEVSFEHLLRQMTIERNKTR